ncbi:hypothetical protein [Asticcacaulis taihuensis]|uniref:hypothetical protein n=1 Tax=Asticcacaulis taihuensis TaxID=260084 RepID=UPI0026EC049C|nr:hypothetical protein [Asticcacaulis taihuensis]
MIRWEPYINPHNSCRGEQGFIGRELVATVQHLGLGVFHYRNERTGVGHGGSVASLSEAKVAVTRDLEAAAALRKAAVVGMMGRELKPRRGQALRWLFERGGEGVLSAARMEHGEEVPAGERVLAGGDWSPFRKSVWDGLAADYLVRSERGRLCLTPMGRAVAEGMDPLPEGFPYV